MARIDRLDPADRALVRRASVLGAELPPALARCRLLGDDVPAPDAATWARLGAFFHDDGDGYLRFRRAIVRDAAYAGLPFRIAAPPARRRRRAHRARATARCSTRPAACSRCTSTLAGDHERAWRYARMAADRAGDRYAFAAAADLYRRALDCRAPARDVRTGELVGRVGAARRRARAHGRA